MTRSSIVVIALSVLFAASIVLTARRQRTSERHTFLWLAVAAAVAGLAIWRSAIDAIAAAMGIYYPPSALFFGAGGCVLWLVYRQSLEIAQQKSRLNRLAQEVAVLSAVVGRQEAEEALHARAGGAGDSERAG